MQASGSYLAIFQTTHIVHLKVHLMKQFKVEIDYANYSQLMTRNKLNAARLWRHIFKESDDAKKNMQLLLKSYSNKRLLHEICQISINRLLASCHLRYHIQRCYILVCNIPGLHCHYTGTKGCRSAYTTGLYKAN